MIWSEQHGRTYAAMASEMLKYAGFRDSVNDRLKDVVRFGGIVDETTARTLDDLYRYYGDKSVFEDGE